MIDNLIEIIEETEEIFKEITPDDAGFCLRRSGILLTEQVTYYNMRQFITLLRRVADDKTLKDSLLSLLKALTILEIRNMPAPTIQKLKKISPVIFGKWL